MVPTSRSQANQRAGRAGREAPGECFPTPVTRMNLLSATLAGICYRLYQERVFEELEAVARPEIERAPLSQTVLQLLALDIPDLDPRTFPYPSPPSPAAIQQALRSLVLLEAVLVGPHNKGAVQVTTGYQYTYSLSLLSQEAPGK